ncbi:MAG: glycosyltransferase [Planctomycetes bacterium]|nr:glycosyltransferase [Planctomycetota bacterium]
MDPVRPFGVLHLLPTLSMGGAELHVARLVAGWESGPTRPLVVAMHRGGPVEARLRATNVPVEVIGIQRAPIHRPLAALRDARALEAATLAIAVRHGVALVQTHLSDADWLGLRVGRRLRVPVVITCHDPHLLPQERAATDFRSKLRRFVQARLWRRADAFIAVGAEVVRAIEQVPGVDPARIRLIRSGFESKPLPTAAERTTFRARHAALIGDAHRDAHGEGAREAGGIVLAVGRLVENKGFHHLIDAFAQVAAQRPRARLWIAGDGPEHAALATRIERLGLASRILLLGMRDDVHELLACADLFATATRYEGLGLAAAEALDQGVPVVAFRVSGVEEVVEHERTGLLVPHAAVAALAAATLALLADPERRAAFASAARPSAQRFEIGAARAATLALYAELLRRPAR